MWTRKPGLQTSWPGSPTIPLTKSPIYCPGIGRRTWRSRPPLLLERSSWKIAPTWGAGRVRTFFLLNNYLKNQDVGPDMLKLYIGVIETVAGGFVGTVFAELYK